MVLLDTFILPAGFAETTNIEHIKVHYYWSQDALNPSRLVPVGPQMDLLAPHNRDRLGPRLMATTAGVGTEFHPGPPVSTFQRGC